MTKFESDRMEAVFQYLEDELEHHYKDLLESDDPDRRKLANAKIDRQLMAYDDVKRALKAFHLYDADDAEQKEKYFFAPDVPHFFRFRVLWYGFIESEGFKDEEEEVFVQEGFTEDEAKKHLTSHLLFNHCADKSFVIKEITTLCQLS